MTMRVKKKKKTPQKHPTQSWRDALWLQINLPDDDNLRDATRFSLKL